jgi:peptidoglycan/xylan/chitin deacetylase (PgdA/CDA1 family)
VRDRPAMGIHPLAGLLTVMWHYVRSPRDEPRVGAGSMNPVAFDRQLDRIARNRTVVAWADVAAALDGGPALPPDAALLTFDDGLVDHHRTVAPRLARRGWSGVFFVTARQPGEQLSVGHRIHILLADLSPTALRTAIVERLDASARRQLQDAEAQARSADTAEIDAFRRSAQRELSDRVGPILSSLIEERHGPEGDVADALHLSPAQVAGLRQAGMSIGGHGRRHLWLDWEPTDRVAAEIADTAAFLAPEPRPWALAFPYGASWPDASGALAAAGFSAAFHAAPRQPTGRFDLGRVDAESPDFDVLLERAGR